MALLQFWMNTLMKKDKTHSIIFILDPPALIVDTILLVCSIRKVMPDVQVIAYVPLSKKPLITETIKEFCGVMTVELRFMETEDVFDPHYKQGNKLIAMAEIRDTDYTVFLDTDIVLTRPLDFSNITRSGCVSVVPEGVYTWGKDPTDWDSVYRKFGLKTPTEQVTLVRSGKKSLPYFNAGFVLFPNRPLLDGKTFSKVWLETAKMVDMDSDIPNRRPWLDQITLPVAIKRAGLSHHVLSDVYNFSLSRFQPKNPKNLSSQDLKKIARVHKRVNGADPVVLHHHQPKFFLDSKFEAIPNQLLNQFTCFSSIDELTGPVNEITYALSEVREKITQHKATTSKSPVDLVHFKVLREELEVLKQRLEQARNLNHWPQKITP
jgi:hypothetical protein